MQHDAIPSEKPHAPFDLAAFARRTVIAGIWQAIDDPSEMKFRILLARDCGHISDEETSFMIATNGLAEV